MAAVEQHVKLALRLPPRLLRFFSRHPPAQLASTNPVSTSTSTSTSTPAQQTISIAENTPSSDPNAASSTITVPLSSSSSSSSSEPDLSPQEALLPSKSTHNPFLPFKNPRTGNWHGPTYSLRRQAELYKLAARHHVLPLMPVSHKHPEVREQRRVENGLRVQGTGVGKRVKGKAWERSLHGRLRERQRAMEAMPEMIKEWKERGHGRGWKKWPK